MSKDEKKAIFEALICILKGCIYEPLVALDEKTALARNEYVRSTIKMLQELNKSTNNKL